MTWTVVICECLVSWPSLQELRYLKSKMHLVDLAGSERTKETGASGEANATGPYSWRRLLSDLVSNPRPMVYQVLDGHPKHPGPKHKVMLASQS